MTDRRRPSPVPADGELLSAYLDGELDAGAEAALEARLRDEPALAAELEAIREVAERLAGARAEPPEGYSSRLRERLGAERGDQAGGAPASLDAARSRRERRRAAWPALGTVAAAVAAVALIGGAVVTGFGGGMQDSAEDPDVAFDSYDPLDADEDAAPFAESDDGAVTFDSDEREFSEAPADADGTGAGGGTGEQRSAALGQRQAVSEPSIVDSAVRLSGEAEARAHLAATDEAPSLLGTPDEDARDLAAAFSVAVRRAEPFASGAEPASCLDTVTGGAPAAAVPARVESVVFEGADAIAYVLAVQSSDARTLDRTEAWVVEPLTCATRLFLDVTPQ